MRDGCMDICMKTRPAPPVQPKKRTSDKARLNWLMGRLRLGGTGFNTAGKPYCFSHWYLDRLVGVAGLENKLDRKQIDEAMRAERARRRG